MRTVAKTILAAGLVGAAAFATTAPAAAQGFYFNAPGVHVRIGHPWHRHYYDYYGGGWDTWNGCPPDYTIQGGVCKPYRGPRGWGW